MPPRYEAIPSGRMEYKIRQAVQSALDKTVGAAVGAAWKGAVSATEGKKDELESKARSCLGPVFDKQAELEAHVERLIIGTIGPPLAELAEPIMTPICTVLMGPFAAAFKELCFAFYTRMCAVVADGIRESDLKAVIRDTRCVALRVAATAAFCC